MSKKEIVFQGQTERPSNANRELAQIEEFTRLEGGMLDVSKISLEFWRKGKNLKIEKDGNAQTVVTEADPIVENKIVSIIKGSYPDARVWGEENASEFEPDSWGIDPLDGTNVFSIGGRDWCNAVVRMENGKPVFTTIVVPLGFEGTDIYVAKKGQGAFLKEYLWNGETRTKRLHAFGIEDLAKATFGMRQEDVGNSQKDGASLEERIIAEQIHKLSAKTKGTICLGSTSFVMASVAAGRFSVACAGPQALWDVAMGDVLVREAGGIVTQLNGEPIDYMKGGLKHKTSWLASANEKVHQEALEVLNLRK